MWELVCTQTILSGLQTQCAKLWPNCERCGCGVHHGNSWILKRSVVVAVTFVLQVYWRSTSYDMVKIRLKQIIYSTILPCNLQPFWGFGLRIKRFCTVTGGISLLSCFTCWTLFCLQGWSSCSFQWGEAFIQGQTETYTRHLQPHDDFTANFSSALITNCGLSWAQHYRSLSSLDHTLNKHNSCITRCQQPENVGL